MSVSYSLALATPASVEQVVHEVHQVALAAGLLDDDKTASQGTGRAIALRSGAWVGVGEADPMPWDAVKADFGFAPTVWMTFRLAGTRDVSAQQDDMVRTVSGLLRRISGDAVLHFQYEAVWLLRGGLNLTVSDREDIWSPERLASLPQPYRRATLAFTQE